MPKFSDSATAFRYYQDMPTDIIEARAQAIRSDIASDPECDIASYKAELDALKSVKESRSNDGGHQHSDTRVADMIETRDEADDIFATREYRGAFFRSVMNRDLTTADRAILSSPEVERRADAFNSSTGSASVLPTTVFDEVIKRARDRGGIIGLARSFSVPSGISVPVAGPGSRAQWHKEGARVETESFDTTDVRFDANELLRIFSISAKVEKLSISAFETAIVDELAESIFEEIAYTLIHGTGEDEGEGIEAGVEWTSGKNLLEVESLGWRDIAELIASLHRGYGRNATFVCNNATLYRDVVTLHDDINRPLWATDDLHAGITGRLLGLPLAVDDHVDDGTIYLADWRYLGFNLPEGIAIERSDQSGFRSGLIDFRGLAIADSRVILPDAFAKLVIGG